MNIKIGEKIRELRRRDGRTQEELAEMLGVSTQAVSRWEVSGGYPDMELLPAIANYFHVSIDELFGYHDGRELKIKDITDRADKVFEAFPYPIIKGALSQSFYDCLEMLRTAAAEFPNEPRILSRFGTALFGVGIHEYGIPIRIVEGFGIDEYAEYDTELNSKNPRWQEALKIFERLLKLNPSPKERDAAVTITVQLYKLMGEYEKAKALANAQSPLSNCKEVLLDDLTKGEEKERYRGEKIVKLMYHLALSIQLASSTSKVFLESAYRKQAMLAIVSLYGAVFSDGRCGYFHLIISSLYFLLASSESHFGDISEALEYFDKGFEHIKAYRAFLADPDYSYTAPLIVGIKLEIKPPLIKEDFWAWQLKWLSEALLDELRKNEKYAECFG